MTFQLKIFINKNKGSFNKINKGCSLSFNNGISEKKEILKNEIKNIIKQNKNDYKSIIKYIESNNVKVLKIKNAEKQLKIINEEVGLICPKTGIKALIINLYFLHKFSLKSDALFILNDKENIYKLIEQLHRWYFMKNGFEGFDQKSIKLYLQSKKRDDDVFYDKLSLDDFEKMQQAIKRNIEAASFVIEYTRETIGSKKALNNIKEGSATKI